MIEDAARLGFDGVEILHRQMTDETPAYVNKLKQAAFRNGLALPMLSIHQDFVSPKPEERNEAVAHTKKCIELAARLGIPSVRLNSGRWNTIESFDDLMKVKGNEPPIKGYTDEDAFRWCTESIQACLPAAESAGVLLALENHWGLTTKTENLLAITAESTPRGSGSISIPATSRGSHTRGSRRSRCTQRLFRPRPTTAAANGTRSTWTTNASPHFARRRVSRLGLLEMEGKKIRLPPCPRASNCCVRLFREV